MPLPGFLKAILSIRNLFTITFSLVTLVLFSVILGGCTGPSPGIPDLYLFRILDHQKFELRAAYFGTCTGYSNALTCNSAAGLFKTVNKAPSSLRPYIKMALDARQTVFMPFFEAIATGLFLLAVPLMLYAQNTTSTTKTTFYITKAVTYLFGLAAFITLISNVGVFYGLRGILLAAGNWKDVGTVEIGHQMLIAHCVVFGLCLILFLMNWLATFEGKVGQALAWLFRRNEGGKSGCAPASPMPMQPPSPLSPYPKQEV